MQYLPLAAQAHYFASRDLMEDLLSSDKYESLSLSQRRAWETRGPITLRIHDTQFADSAVGRKP